MVFKTFPHEHQLDAKDCGPACVKIISKYFGCFYSLQYLRDVCGVSRTGVSFLDLSIAFEHIGIRTKALKLTFEKFLKIPMPCIVHWNNNHFIVVYKVSRKNVWVSDPAKGLISYTHAEFQKGWLGKNDKWAVMVVEPMADFKQRNFKDINERKRTFKNLIGYLTPYKSGFVSLLIVMFIVTSLQALLPFMSKAVIDVGIQSHDIDFINLVLIGNIVIIVSVLLCNLVRDWVLLHVTSRINIALISDYLIKLFKLPITFYENKLTGDILQRAADHDRIRHFLTNNSVSFLFSLLTFFVFGFILFYFNSILCLIYLIGSLIFVSWVLIFMRFRQTLDWQYFDLNSQNQSYWVETISTIADIKVNNYDKQKRWKWEGIQANLFKVNQKILTINNAQNLGAQFINQLTNLLITFFSAKAVINGNITFGAMISTQFIIGQLNGPIMQFVSFIQAAQAAKVSFLRLNEIHQLEEEEVEKEINNNILIPEFKTLILKNIHFQYTRNGLPILRNINLIIPEGKVTAIVGDSGSGKTTLLKLILRLYKPSYGEISIGHLNIENVNLRQWRNKCGAVMQDGKIFNDTVLNNIVLEDENIDYGRFQKAVKAANIADEIEQLALGYQTVMGEQGRGLSGGQKQRILIARALYKDPDYLFFDEATNSLDSINEQKITSSLDDIFRGKTVIIVAHRLSTIRKADQIVVMRSGTIVEVGNHNQLMENNNSQYAQLVQAQTGLNQL